MKLLGVLAVFVSLGILGISIYLAINPQEQAREKRDEILLEDSKSFVESVKNYYKEKKDYPWDKNAIPSETSLAKMDSILAKLQEATDFRGVTKGVEEEIFVTYDATGQEIKACFLPESKTYLFHAQDEGRKTTCTIKKLQ